MTAHDWLGADLPGLGRDWLGAIAELELPDDVRCEVERIVSVAMATSFDAGRRNGIGTCRKVVDAAGMLEARALLWRVD